MNRTILLSPLAIAALAAATPAQAEMPLLLPIALSAAMSMRTDPGRSASGVTSPISANLTRIIARRPTTA